MDKIISPKVNLTGEFFVPGDKSISHRAIMFGSIAKGLTTVDGFLEGEDCLATIDCFRKMGVSIDQNGTSVNVHGNGLHGLKPPTETLDVVNSGTAIRLLAGLLSGQKFTSEITGDESIQKRPMDRVITPLSQMNAKISGKIKPGLAPLVISESQLKGITYELPVASAQIKSSILLASLYAQGTTTVIEKEKTRDHSEIMLNAFGANIKTDGNKVISTPVSDLYGQKVSVPGDISSAAFLIVAASILPNSHIVVKNIGVNQTRTGIIDALLEMGADIKIINNKLSSGEMVGDIEVKTSKLKGITLKGDIIPRMIDEIPVFAVAALFAEGKTIIQDAQELKVKESNRIQAMVTELTKMGANVSETEDGMIITGGSAIKGAVVNTYNDHRIAMSLAIAGLNAIGNTTITNSEIANISFPNFYELIEK